MVTIFFESHATSLDNEAGLASGVYDIKLSKLGEQQARELEKRYANEYLDAIFCSNLERSYKTAEIAFTHRGFSIIQDMRLKECNYGDLTRHSSKEIELEKVNYITKPFPNGESYEQAVERIKNFLIDLLKNYDEKKVTIIGHRATQYGLELWINGISLDKIITAHWEWQPGWIYHLEAIKN